MSYPLSSDVAAGDNTASAQYNNLRSDALRLGNLATDSINLGSLIEFFESKLNIIRLATNTVRVAASFAVPGCLGGCRRACSGSGQCGPGGWGRTIRGEPIPGMFLPTGRPDPLLLRSAFPQSRPKEPINAGSVNFIGMARSL